MGEVDWLLLNDLSITELSVTVSVLIKPCQQSFGLANVDNLTTNHKGINPRPKHS